MGQKIDYDQSWKTVDKLIEEERKYNSALTLIEKIRLQARQEKNGPELIKSVIYSLNHLHQVEEDYFVKSATLLNNEIKEASEPDKSILHSIAGDFYYRIFSQYRWRIYNRTAISEFTPENPETWTIENFHKKIQEHYLASLSNTESLKAVSSDKYDKIIRKGNRPQSRPTLFDIVAHRALEYFITDERTLNSPEVFIINNPEAFSNAENFIKIEFHSADSASLHIKALQIFQEILKFHINSENKTALIEADLMRLNFVNQYAVVADKEKLYENALLNLAHKYGVIPETADAWKTIVQIYINQGNTYSPFGDTTQRMMLRKAVLLGDSILCQTKDKAFNELANIINNVKTSDLSLEVEQTNAVNQPFRMKIQYKNLNRIFTRIIKVNEKQRNDFTRRAWENDSWSELLNLPVVYNKDFNIPETGDYQHHSVELPLPGIASGEYVVIVSDDAKFSLNNSNNYVAGFIYVSDLTFLRNGQDFFVLNAVTGQPVEAAKIKAWRSVYDNQKQNYFYQAAGEFTSDKNGQFLFTSTSNNRNESISFEIIKGSDRIHLTEETVYFNFRNNKEEYKSRDDFEKENQRIHFFTDRAIYRPGQDIFYKAILMTRDFNTRNSKILEQKKIKIYFKDANGELIDSSSITTNNFGSIHGRFTIPEVRLNGRFSISAEGISGMQTVSVEEYKRPKYQVNLLPEKEAYRFNDSVLVKGTVEGYAGNALGGTKVSYRVIRKPVYRTFYGNWRRSYFPPVGREVEITNGITTSAADGSFEISFKTIPDPKADRKHQPRFMYEVVVTTSDISGEAGEAKTIIHAGYNNLQLNIEFPFQVSLGEELIPVITSTDIAGKPKPAVVHTKIYELANPEKNYRKRLWEAPDLYVLTKEEFENLFPFDLYENNEDPGRFKIKSLIKSQSDSVSENGKKITDISWKSGWYKIESKATLESGDSAVAEHYVRILSPEAAGEIFINAQAQHQQVQPGGSTSINITSNIKSPLQLLYSRQIKDSSGIYYTMLNGFRKINLKDENSKGSINFNYAAVYQHRAYFNSVEVAVEDSTKNLDIDLISFRDKLLPGNNETWTVKINSKKGDKIAAEFLTTMYDLSLDQYINHQWRKPVFYNTVNPLNSWQNILNNKSRVFTNQRNYPWLETIYSSTSNFIYSKFHSYGFDEYDMSAAPTMMAQNESLGSRRDKLDRQASMERVREEEAGGQNEPQVQIRTNLNETAFFFPDLKTDEQGNVSFSFTAPEALTSWKWMMLAHDRELSFGYKESRVITQKDLMVQPNVPRFLREGDKIDLKLRISNLTDKELTGTAGLRLNDASSGISVDGWFNNVFPDQYFTVGPKETIVASFNITVPAQFSKPLSYTFIAKAENHSDGESAVIPIVTNRILVTETYPVNLTEKNTVNIKIPSLGAMENYTTANPHALTIEFSSNPLWYAVQALPYLKNNNCDCIDQAFNVYYANAMAAMITSSMPQLIKALKEWKIADSSQFLSNLEKNQELKNILLKETPWVMEAKTEAEQKRNLLLLFELSSMEKELQTSLNKIKEWQSPEGGFSWIKGIPHPDRYMTQQIIEGFGKLKNANAIPENHRKEIYKIVTNALQYLDKKTEEEYSRLLARKVNLKNYILSPVEIQYLYVRSYFPEIPVDTKAKQAYKFYEEVSLKKWQQQTMLVQAMLATYHYRQGDKKAGSLILESFKDNANRDSELGMYWKNLNQGYYWHEGKIEAQAKLIELFTETGQDKQDIVKMKLWLLQNKQVNRWNSTRATSNAVYALLTEASYDLAQPPVVNISIADQQFSTANSATAKNLGYIKASIPGERIKPEMSEISITRSQASALQPTWGAVYYQYFEEADKVAASSNSGLKLEKELFLIKNTPSGQQLETLKNNAGLKIGDKIMVRIIIQSDRDMEYIHMKDLRAPALEPGIQLSGYKWQDGLGYYQSIGDLAVNFYFDRLPRGTFVFEYPLQVTQTGTFSNGITSIQSYYAPEFSSHSKGIKLIIEE